MKLLSNCFSAKITPTTVIALIALFFAIDGGAAGAAESFISGSSIRPHTITLKQLSASSIASLRGQAGAAGPAGAQGPAGVSGPAGAQGAAGAAGSAGSAGSGSGSAPAAPTATALGEKVYSVSFTLNSNSESSDSADCPAGQVATGGGGGASPGTGGTWNGIENAYMEGSAPVLSSSTHLPIGWNVEFLNTLPVSFTYPVYVICINQ